MVRHPARAEELAQDTFVKAYQQLHTFDPSRRFASWLLTIAHHVAIDEVRRRQHATEPLDEASARHAAIVDPRSEDPTTAIERAELARVLNTAMRHLRPEYVELLTLRYEHDLELAEIAAVTGLPIGTVKSSLYRARQALAEALRETGWRPS
jgi:RNA polymerase sigma-70 factor (ECF subfamily)